MSIRPVIFLFSLSFTMPTKIQSFQNTRNNAKNLTACVDVSVYETAIRCAELQGYETISSFVKDAILEKVKRTAVAMTSIAESRMTKAC